MTNAPAEPPPALSAREWIDLLFDEASFDEAFTGVPTPDPLQFEDSKTYPERLEEARRASGGQEAVITGIASIGGMQVVAAISDFRFIGGSMGFAVGERVGPALPESLPLLRSLVVNGVVIAHKSDLVLKHIEFIRLDSERAMVVLVGAAVRTYRRGDEPVAAAGFEVS